MATTIAAEVASPALVFETMTAFQRSSALCAAIELDVFRAIGWVTLAVTPLVFFIQKFKAGGKPSGGH